MSAQLYVHDSYAFICAHNIYNINYSPPATPSLGTGDIIDGKYVQSEKGIRNITMIGQRLFTGRVVIAESCLIFARSLLAETKAYAERKMCWGPENDVQLGTIPQLRSLFQEVRVSEM